MEPHTACSGYEFLMRTFGASRLPRAQRAGFPALHRVGGSVGLWGQGTLQREESGGCFPFYLGLIINCRSRGAGGKAQCSHRLSGSKAAFSLALWSPEGLGEQL